MNKLISCRALKKKCDIFRKTGKKVVFTNGCFDLIHPGHIKILKFAKSKGDILIVGLNSDLSVKAIKGPSRPILDQKSRAEVLSAVEYVDFIVFFDDPTPYTLIKALRPHYLVKGSDWQAKNIIGSDIVDKIFRVPLIKGKSTTEIIKKILRICKK